MSSTTIALELDDLDQVAIERALIGDGVALAQLAHAEQLEVVRRLTEQGQSIADIAARLATSTATVSRRRAALCASA